MKEKTIRALYITVGCIPFIWLLIYTVVDSWDYFSIGNYFFDLIFNIGRFPWVLVGLVLILIGALIPMGNKDTIVIAEESKETAVVGKNNKKPLWIILMVLGVIPFAAPILMLVYGVIINDPSSNNMSDFFLLWSYIFWPTYIVGGFLIVLSSLKLKKSN